MKIICMVFLFYYYFCILDFIQKEGKFRVIEIILQNYSNL